HEHGARIEQRPRHTVSTYDEIAGAARLQSDEGVAVCDVQHLAGLEHAERALAHRADGAEETVDRAVVAVVVEDELTAGSADQAGAGAAGAAADDEAGIGPGADD